MTNNKNLMGGFNGALFNGTPAVLVPAGTYFPNFYKWHMVEQRYILAVHHSCNAFPLILPAINDPDMISRALELVDGILLPGGISNIHPSNYGVKPTDDHRPYDRPRDCVTLQLLPKAINAGLPVFALCRGLQELNVAFGGTIGTEVQKLPGKMDHRSPPDYKTLDERFALRHEIVIEPGGKLEKIAGCKNYMVNSLHRQAIAKLGQGLQVEAYARDGIIEAVSVPQAKNFALGVQWHPEYNSDADELSKHLFNAFKMAVYQRFQQRTNGV